MFHALTTVLYFSLKRNEASSVIALPYLFSVLWSTAYSTDCRSKCWFWYKGKHRFKQVFQKCNDPLNVVIKHFWQRSTVVWYFTVFILKCWYCCKSGSIYMLILMYLWYWQTNILFWLLHGPILIIYLKIHCSAII